VRRFACGGLINRLGIGPSIVSLALLRAGMSPLLDLSADWAAAEAAQILDDPSSEDDSSSACAAAAAGLGPSVFGPCPQLVKGVALTSLCCAHYMFTPSSTFISFLVPLAPPSHPTVHVVLLHFLVR